MITIDHAEVARHHVADQLRTAEHHALLREGRLERRADRPSGARHGLASVLRRLADRLEPQQRQARPGLSVVR